jgi:cytochrome c biogenesis protein CcmG, thiol:disulfide interchange protein DsbE
MKKIIFLLLLSFGFTYAQSQDLPTTTIRDINGKQIAFNETHTKGKVTMYSFWATWCVPCKLEINNIKGKLDQWKKEVDFEYVTIALDDARSVTQIKTYTKAKGWTFPVYHDPNSDLKRSLNFQDIPFTIIVDKEGKIVYQHTGYEEGGENELFAKIKELSK